jgi:hypothetical protein
VKNPYTNGTDVPHHELHKVTARVHINDYRYVKRLFGGAVTGLSDKIISNLYKKLVDELRTYGFDPDISEHIAWHTEHPNHTVIDRIVAGISFARLSGEYTGHPSGGDVGRTASELREKCSVLRSSAQTRKAQLVKESVEEHGAKRKTKKKDSVAEAMALLAQITSKK